MSEDKEAKAPIDFSHLGGKKVGHPVAATTQKPIDFSHLGGKCVLKAPEPTAPEESVEK